SEADGLIRWACPPDQKPAECPPEQQADGGVGQVTDLKMIIVIHDLKRKGLSMGAMLICSEQVHLKSTVMLYKYHSHEG
ncbi:MAG: hypothetical protein OXF74_11325, partial [Rhodobacteraceae bacterium]|nr:hypothetical protein [Paracoccaceae bacterium]